MRYLIRFLTFLTIVFSLNCQADYDVTLGTYGFETYKTLDKIPPDLLPNIGDEYTLESGKQILYSASKSNEHPPPGSWWGCWGGKSTDGRVLGTTPEGFIKSGNEDYAFVFGISSEGNARCRPGATWWQPPFVANIYVNNNYIKLRRIAKTGDSSAIQYPKVFICIMPSDRGGSYESKCNTYSSVQNNSSWQPDRSSVTPEPLPAACTAQIMTHGAKVPDYGTIQLETISTYGTIGLPPNTLYQGKSFNIEPASIAGEKCQDFSTSSVTFNYNQVLSQGNPVVSSDNSDVGFVIKRNDNQDYVRNGEQLNFSELDPEFKVNYWSMTPNAKAGNFNSGTVTLNIVYN